MILLLDATNNFVRNYVVNPTLDGNGDPVGGVVGFLLGLKNMVREIVPNLVVAVWDGPGGSVRRRSVYSEYKAGRQPRLNREYDDGDVDRNRRNMERQSSLVRSYLSLLGVDQLSVPDIEADDTIAYLARHVFHDERKVIVSTDKDFYQLIDPSTVVYSPTKKLYIGDEWVREHVGVFPTNYILLKALCGDGSDNVRGVKGFGQRTATKLFPILSERPVTLEELLEFARENEPKSRRFAAVVAQRSLLSENVRLMQLSSPTISAQSTRSIRTSLGVTTGLNLFELRLALLRDQITLRDVSIFDVFREYWARRSNR